MKNWGENMNELLASKFFWVSITFMVYFIAHKAYAHYKHPLLNPVFLSVLSIIAILHFSKISYGEYNKGGQIISFFLGPAVVALGVPLYRHLDDIKKHSTAIVISLLAGSIGGILAASGLALMLGAPRSVIISIAPKSATTPIAMGIVEKAGGISPLTAAIVIVTGILGAITGPWLMKILGIKSASAFGMAIGAASHGIGTARAAEEGDIQGAFSGLALCINGILTAIFTPILLNLILKLAGLPGLYI
jgi:predicted murein hydrolase (TIGR00659 family)